MKDFADAIAFRVGCFFLTTIAVTGTVGAVLGALLGFWLGKR